MLRRVFCLGFSPRIQVMGTETEVGPTIWTVGHSNHTLEYFLDLLDQEPKITFLVDVRTSPASSYSPQFNKETLEKALNTRGVNYVHLKGLGGRPSEEFCYASDGRVIYDELESTKSYINDLRALETNAKDKICVVMCSCGSPEHCHRNLSISYKLVEHGFRVIDILPDGTREQSHPPIVEDTLFGDKEVRKSKLPVRQTTTPNNFSL